MRRLAIPVLCLALVPLSAFAVIEDPHQQALVRYRAGQELMYSEKWEDAAQEFSEATRLDPLFGHAFHDLGQCRMNLKEYPAALKAFTDSREAFRKSFELRSTDTTKADFRLDQEITEMRDGLQIARSSKLANTFTVMKIEDRIRELESQKKRGAGGAFETPAEVSLGLGSAYLRLGQLDDAEREYLAAVKARPKFGEAHNNLAVIYLKRGRLPEAEQQVKLAEKSGFTVPPGLKDAIKGGKN